MKLTFFIDEFLSPDNDDSCPDAQEKIRNYSLCLLKYYFIFNDFKDAAREGNGERLATLHKQSILHFKALPGFSAYAIEMMISIVQNEALLSEAESQHCMWVPTTNWKGGHGKNIEIDLLQENRNKDIKKSIKGMGAKKINEAIDDASRAAGGQRKIVANFDVQINRATSSTSHTHRSTATDEGKVLADLVGRRFPTGVRGG